VSDSFDLEAPDHFTTGAVGPPGQRVFYLQGRERGALVTLKVEKGQVNALSEYIGGLLGRQKGGADAPERGADAPDPDDVALIEPIEPAWAVASIGVGYDETTERVVIVAQELVAEAEEDQPAPESASEPASARFHITREQAVAFVARARELVRAGRPLCPLCSQPKDPEGHICPRANGHVVPRE
jgi:uncharacterized repeat protein (TIGR03847 family)